MEELATRGLYEDAISLHTLCAADAPEYVKGVDINRLAEGDATFKLMVCLVSCFQLRPKL